jgi:hypothetical protein
MKYVHKPLEQMMLYIGVKLYYIKGLSEEKLANLQDILNAFVRQDKYIVFIK